MSRKFSFAEALPLDGASGRPDGAFHLLIQQPFCWSCFDKPESAVIGLVGQSELLRDWGLKSSGPRCRA